MSSNVNMTQLWTSSINGEKLAHRGLCEEVIAPLMNYCVQPQFSFATHRLTVRHAQEISYMLGDFLSSRLFEKMK